MIGCTISSDVEVWLAVWTVRLILGLTIGLTYSSTSVVLAPDEDWLPEDENDVDDDDA